MAEEKKTNKIVGFFKDCKREMKNIVWSPRKDVIKNTTVATLYVAVSAAVILVLDLGFTKLLDLIASLFN
ncbi:MAG: preprotein translocase subunit SecE [Clostridia bacterium]|nr:preprotein translocase subunit SecE [Clostridia bacterium]MBR5459445.1 preprotein translocase subunit SecE [Clostridia bacterium]